MAEGPWLTIVGLGEDGPEGLPPASRKAIAECEVVMGPPRHLDLLGPVAAETITWPAPFADGIETLLGLRGRKVVVLASGDPFWFGAGSVIARHLDPGEWVSHPAPSSFSLATNRLGWPLERVTCLGLHATEFGTVRPHLSKGARCLLTVRDGDAARELCVWLTETGFGPSMVHFLEALGGPRERVRCDQAQTAAFNDILHPVMLGIEVAGDGVALSLASGRADAVFANDGQITKRPVRALTLSALAPQPGEHLWDIGAGSGSISIEWMLAHPTMRATAIEARSDRAGRVRANARALGVPALAVVEGRAPEVLDRLDPPDAVFVGGGMSEALLQALADICPAGCRLVVNAVTLESEALLVRWQALKGGELMRVELSTVAALGPKHGWKAAYPVVQWSVVL